MSTSLSGGCADRLVHSPSPRCLNASDTRSAYSACRECSSYVISLSAGVWAKQGGTVEAIARASHLFSGRRAPGAARADRRPAWHHSVTSAGRTTSPVHRFAAGDPRDRFIRASSRHESRQDPPDHVLGERELGEPITFEDLFATEHRRLFRALCLITRDPHEAEDIGQEAFVRVFERWDRVGSLVDPVGYLYRVAMNVFRSRYRRARVAARRITWRGARDEISEVDERDAVVRMLGELNSQQRAALVLTSLLGYSSDEAGEVLGIRGSTVRVLTTRARATLRREGSLLL